MFTIQNQINYIFNYATKSIQSKENIKILLIFMVLLTNILKFTLISNIKILQTVIFFQAIGLACLSIKRSHRIQTAMWLIISSIELESMLQFAPFLSILLTNSVNFTLGSFFVLVVMNIMIRMYNNHGYFILNQPEDIKWCQYYLMHLIFAIGFHYIIMEYIRKISEANQQIQELQQKCETLKTHNEELIKSKNKFVLRVSHELRNPLNIVLGNLEVALHELSNSSLQIQEIIKSSKIFSEILLNLINNLLDTAKLESGTIEINPMQINIRHLIERIWSSCSDPINKKKLKGSIHFYHDIPKKIMIDPHRLMQIFFNLVNNAIQHTDKGNIRIIVSWVYNEDLSPSYLFDDDNDNNPSQSKPSHIYGSLAKIGKIFNENNVELKGNFKGNNISTTMTTLDKGDKMNYTLSDNEKSRSQSRKKNIIKSTLNGDPKLISYFSNFQHTIASRAMNSKNSFCEMGDSHEFSHEEGKTNGLNKSLNNPNYYYSMDSNQKKFHLGSSKLLKKTRENSTQYEGYLKIEIIDSGCGISKEEMANIFNKFQENQVRNIGTGLGLWLTTSIIEKMNGQFAVYSKKNHGSAFLVLLKSISIPDNSNSPSPILRNSMLLSKKLIASNKLASKTISDDTLSLTHETNSKKCKNPGLCAMIVDDMTYNQLVHKQILNMCKVSTTHIASNGLEAVNMYKQKGENYFDFIIMDIDMPVMDGKEACRRIRKYEDEMGIYPRVKIIILTGYTTEEEKHQCLDPKGDIKADYFFGKPMNFASCECLIKELLAKKVEKTEHKKSESCKSRYESFKQLPNINANYMPTYEKPLSTEDITFGNEILKYESNTEEKFINKNDGEINSALSSSSYKSAPEKLINMHNRDCVLFIEDYSELSHIATEISNTTLFKYIICHTLGTALASIEQNIDKIHTIIIDCDCIIFDGYSICQEIIKYLSNHGLANIINIYGITAVQGQYTINKGIQYGMRDIIYKPLTSHKLIKIIETSKMTRWQTLHHDYHYCSILHTKSLNNNNSA